MFIAMGLMLLGMILGWLLRGRAWLGLLTRCVSPAIMLLLFSLGVAVGGNRELMNNLPLLGGKALLLTLAGVAGSLACVAVIRRWFRDFPAVVETRSDTPPRSVSNRPPCGKFFSEHRPCGASTAPHQRFILIRNKDPEGLFSVCPAAC